MLHGSTYHIKTFLFCVIEDVELLYTCSSINLLFIRLLILQCYDYYNEQLTV